VDQDGTLGHCRVYYDGMPKAKKGNRGSADGLAIDEHGNVWATAPGGVAVISPEGKHLGSLITTQRTANCKFGEDGSTLFIAADDYMLRIRLTTKGVGF
jgi:gluconolactonase